MNSSNLHPPNICGLSDKVIGNIMHPTWEPRNMPDNCAMHLQPRGQRPGARPHYHKEMTSVSADPATAQVSPATARAAPLTKPWVQPTTRKRCNSTSSWSKALQSIAVLQASGYGLTEQQQRAIMEDVWRKESRHRFLQASYKWKQNEAIVKAEHDIRHLRGAVEVLQRQVKSARIRAKPKLNHGAIAKTYQQQFLAFVSDPVRQKPSASAFLRCIMAPEVASDPICGVEAVLEDWRLISTHFDDVHFELNDLRALTADILVGTTTTSVTITGRTFRWAFSHLKIYGMRGGKWTPSAIKLLGEKLVMRGSMRFHLDNASERVVRIERQADMLSPLIRALGSLESVHQVLNQSLITPDFQFRSNALSAGVYSIPNKVAP